MVKAGLWEQDVRLLQYDKIDFQEVYRLAENQSVLGLVAAGLEHVLDTKVPKTDVLTFVGNTLQLEQRNQAMNYFIGVLEDKLREAGVKSVLVKGQGIALCYEKPLWRACGDVDLLLDEVNYQKAKRLLLPLSTGTDEEDTNRLHLGINIGPWLVELHGTLHSGLGDRVDQVLDEVQTDTLNKDNVRIWKNDSTDVRLPEANNDVVFVFTHILQHYFGGGIGLRQICDWCRLLWTYRDETDSSLLERRLERMGLKPKWQAFAALAVDWLGMPAMAMPLYSPDKNWTRKGRRILSLVLESGNFGHGRDTSYKQKCPKLIEYLISFWTYTRYGLLQFMIFPKDAVKGWVKTISLGIKSKLKSKD